MAKHLWGHVSTTHKGHPMVTCGLCQRTFSSVSNLEDHKRVKHKDESNTELVSSFLIDLSLLMLNELSIVVKLFKIMNFIKIIDFLKKLFMAISIEDSF